MSLIFPITEQDRQHAFETIEALALSEARVAMEVGGSQAAFNALLPYYGAYEALMPPEPEQPSAQYLSDLAEVDPDQAFDIWWDGVIRDFGRTPALVPEEIEDTIEDGAPEVDEEPPVEVQAALVADLQQTLPEDLVSGDTEREPSAFEQRVQEEREIIAAEDVQADEIEPEKPAPKPRRAPRRPSDRKAPAAPRRSATPKDG